MSKSQNHQVIRPIGKPLTDEEKKQRVIQFVQQKRENFSINILCSLAQGAITYDKPITKESLLKVVDVAVDMADALFEKLYPLPEEEQKKEPTPVQKLRDELKGNLLEEICESEVCTYKGKGVCTYKRQDYCPMFTPKKSNQ